MFGIAGVRELEFNLDKHFNKSHNCQSECKVDFAPTVLTVDDEKNILNSLKRLLRKATLRLLTALDRLVRITKQPHGRGAEGPATHPGIMTGIDKGVGVVLLRIVNAHALLCMFASLNQISKKE